jgi:tRNA threonylcarbamoyladenosine biosynthesis protein TsaE
MKQELIMKTENAQQTMKLGKKFAELLDTNLVIGLIGDLGAGKTCFVKGMAEGVGYDFIENVTSPTFTIINEYHGKISLFHFDLYRIHSENDFDTIGFYDYLDKQGICVIEWVCNVDDVIKRDIDIKIEIKENDVRVFTFIVNNEKLRNRIHQFCHSSEGGNLESKINQELK